ncbi:MAG: glycosyltransferase family 1 protein [Actinomyces sp.]|nr:MAG: glycosyltransferase family 1 protein [Actinomyces sp.]
MWVAADRHGCGNYRVHQPAQHLIAAGDIEIPPSPPSTALDVRDLQWADVVVVQRPVNDEIVDVIETVTSAPPPRPAVVVELDDDLERIPTSSPIARAALGQPDRVAALHRAIRAADAVWVSTPFLADRVHEVDPDARVAVLPNAVPDAALAPPPVDVAAARVIGYSSSVTHAADVELVAWALKSALREVPDAALEMVGVDWTRAVPGVAPRPVVRGVPRDRVRFSPWVHDLVGHVTRLGFTLGVAPLTGSAFNMAKSDIKIRELAVRGIPVVVSPVGPYVDHPCPGVVEVRDNSPRGWRDTLVDLLTDDDRRARLGARALEWAMSDPFVTTTDAWRSQYVDAIADAIAILCE